MIFLFLIMGENKFDWFIWMWWDVLLKVWIYLDSKDHSTVLDIGYCWVSHPIHTYRESVRWRKGIHLSDILSLLWWWFISDNDQLLISHCEHFHRRLTMCNENSNHNWNKSKFIVESAWYPLQKHSRYELIWEVSATD